MHVMTPTHGALVVRGVAYSVGLHVYHEGGRWQHREYHDVRVQRTDGTFRDASNAARRTVTETVEAAISEWAAHHPEVIRDAAHVEVGNREEAMRRDIAKLESELADKRAALAAIVRERRALDVASALVSDL